MKCTESSLLSCVEVTSLAAVEQHAEDECPINVVAACLIRLLTSVSIEMVHRGMYIYEKFIPLTI